MRTTTWVGKVGLIYPSDYVYASLNEDCASNIKGSGSLCSQNNWLHNGNYWTITSLSNSNYSYLVWRVETDLHVNTYHAYGISNVRPSVYLSSHVKIIYGNGDDKPYILSI